MSYGSNIFFLTKWIKGGKLFTYGNRLPYRIDDGTGKTKVIFLSSEVLHKCKAEDMIVKTDTKLSGRE